MKKAEKLRQSNIRNKEADILKLEELLTTKPPDIEPEEELAEQLVRTPLLRLDPACSNTIFAEITQIRHVWNQGGV